MNTLDSRETTYQEAAGLIERSQTERQAALDAAMAHDPERAREHWHKHRDAETKAHDLLHQLMDS